MKMLNELISNDYGLMSLAVIVFMLGMMWYMYKMVVRKMDEAERSSKTK